MSGAQAVGHDRRRMERTAGPVVGQVHAQRTGGADASL